MTDHALRLLRQDRRPAALAAFPFDFDVERAAHGHVEPVRLASGAGPLEVVAGDDTGGTYFVCPDGSMLYASSEGVAGIIGSTADEALEILIGLPAWRSCTDLSPQDGEERILARVAEAEDEMREYYGIDEERAELRAALGFPERSPVELVGLLHAALLRTEPDFVLLNGEEFRAYDRLDDLPRPPLWEPVLERGRADLALLRAGDQAAVEAVAADPVRRRVVLRAAQFDRAEGDLGWLRRLLPAEAASSMTDELRLAAVLVGLHGDAADLPLLHEVRETDFDTHCGLSDVPGPGADGAGLRRWALEMDEALFGTDPADESMFTWTSLALDQGLTEPARVALIRRLDAIEVDQSLLRRPDDPTQLDTTPLELVAEECERLGDLEQALRARRLHASLQETSRDRAYSWLDQAGLERRTGRLTEAVRSLASVLGALDGAANDSLRHWRQVNLGLFVAREHYELSGALAAAGLLDEALAVLATADGIRAGLGEAAARGVRELAETTAASVRAVS
ncbi:hypothetical protein ACWC10_18515 [Streptomyces sp. NPDC001595]|uniref:hypothetical protein n=1 Tax=Streptomyces sp. NPDC001532 TaxID=3154520 RepID=UPI00332E5135